MATYKKDRLLSSNTFYTVHPDAKRYTLRDNGFLESKNGSFQYERALSLHNQNKKTPKLKLVISKDIDELKLTAVTSKWIKEG